MSYAVCLAPVEARVFPMPPNAAAVGATAPVLVTCTRFRMYMHSTLSTIVTFRHMSYGNRVFLIFLEWRAYGFVSDPVACWLLSVLLLGCSFRTRTGAGSPRVVSEGKLQQQPLKITKEEERTSFSVETLLAEVAGRGRRIACWRLCGATTPLCRRWSLTG